MQTTIKSYFSIICLILFCSATLLAQKSDAPQEGDFVRVEMKDGKSYKGSLNTINTKEILLNVDGTGTITIKRNLVDEIVVYDFSTGSAIFDYDNPLYSRYFLSESAISLKEGEGFYQNILIFLNFFSYGVTDNFSISGGFETLSLFNGRVPVFFINPKLTVHSPNEKLHFGVGTIAGFSVESDATGFGGAAYGNVTFGDKNNNFTVGAGLPYASEGGFANLPVVQIAGMGRVSNRMSFVGEIFIANLDDDFFNDGNLTFGTASLRFMTKQAVFDVGAFIISGGAAPVAAAALIF